jgi:hypothetical protein
MTFLPAREAGVIIEPTRVSGGMARQNREPPKGAAQIFQPLNHARYQRSPYAAPSGGCDALHPPFPTAHAVGSIIPPCRAEAGRSQRPRSDVNCIVRTAECPP